MVDNGTTVTKAALFDVEGREIAAGSENVGLGHPAPSWAEQSMEGIWQAVVKAIFVKETLPPSQLLAAFDRVKALAAIKHAIASTTR